MPEEHDAATPPKDDERVRSHGLVRTLVGVTLGLVQFVVVVGLIGSGLFAARWFNRQTEVAASSGGEREEVARLVEIALAERTDAPVIVRAMGTVMPAQEAVLRPRVSGMIVEQSESFVPGGFFERGDFVAQLDRADYERVLEQRRSEVDRADAALQIELGDQAVAREELELLEVDIPEINRDLILRIPQVNQAKADLRSARAAVARAELDLERARIVAPFAGQLVERVATVGNNVTAGEPLGTLIGTERYWIELSVPVSSLRWIEAAESAGEGSPVTIRYPAAWGPGRSREGIVARRIGRLEQGSRLARVLVEVLDPLALDAAEPGIPGFILGAYVDAEIEGRILRNVFVIERDSIREREDGAEVVWVMGEDGRLEFRPIEIEFAGPREAWVRGGLETGDRIVRTNLTTPVEGMLLRVAGNPVGGETASASPGGGAEAEESAGG